jgi:Uma2 family endonuclease
MTINRYTPQEYYARERLADDKSDYFHGQIFKAALATARHSLISANIGGEVGNRLKGKLCRVYDSNLRMAVLATGFRCYPDVSVYCEPLVFDIADTEGETAVNPSSVANRLAFRIIT